MFFMIYISKGLIREKKREKGAKERKKKVDNARDELKKRREKSRKEYIQKGANFIKELKKKKLIVRQRRAKHALEDEMRGKNYRKNEDKQEERKRKHRKELNAKLDHMSNLRSDTELRAKDVAREARLKRAVVKRKSYIAGELKGKDFGKVNTRARWKARKEYKDSKEEWYEKRLKWCLKNPKPNCHHILGLNRKKKKGKSKGNARAVDDLLNPTVQTVHASATKDVLGLWKRHLKKWSTSLSHASAVDQLESPS